jgi:hypothetical protein
MSFPNSFPVDSSNPDLLPDQFLYGRKGPWPQPSPSHPLKEAAEVLNIPPLEALVWNSTIGERYLTTQLGYPGVAARAATVNLTLAIPTDEQFNNLMLNTAYSRYMKPLADAERRRYADKIPNAAGFKYDFSAMKLVKPLEGMYCAPVVCFFAQGRGCVAILFRGDTDAQDVLVLPSEGPAWNVAKIYALQGAAYHMLFVVHPALHFPMDSVNAITKTAVPYTHPLFQALFPHTGYSLALDNAVLEGADSVVNNNAQGSWIDPLMANAYNLKLLFGAGYTGLRDPWYGDAYPPYDYMKPQKGFDSDYGRWLADYFQPFLTLCTAVAEEILTADRQDTYVRRWARYNATYVQGFPDEKSILDRDCLAQAMAIYMWDVTVSHGGDHYSFGINIPAPYKFLRIRHYGPVTRNYGPATAPNANGPTKVGDIANGDDLYRMEMAEKMFFTPSAIFPNLSQTLYPFTNTALSEAGRTLPKALGVVSEKYEPYSKDNPCMPLTTDQARKVLESDPPSERDPSLAGVEPLTLTIPASIQY